MFNWIKTAALMAAITALFGVIGASIGGKNGMIMALGFAVVSNFFAYWFSDKMVLKMYRAREVDASSAPQFYQTVQELAQRAGLPMPRVYLIDEDAPNAFATGRDPHHAAVCATQGILQLLNERELRGVLGHELSHVYNRDILTSSVAAGIAGVISSMVTMAMWFGGGNRRDRDGGNIIAVLLLSLLAPLAAAITQFAISRTREYDADHDGAELTQDPLALASALSKLESGISRVPMGQDPRLEPVSSMMIANPFGSLRNLFSTHPPMDKRIARLEQMAGY